MSGSRSRFPAYALLVALVLSLGVGVRVAQFPRNPPGFNQDEAASAYEAYSLAETGRDKWGNALPAYFPAWGSGQNVLLAYLTVPAIKVFGLSVFSARLPALVLGLLTLPLLFFSLLPVGRGVALLGLLLLAVAPWHFLLARWGLESNLVPFFMLLGCTLLARALRTGRRRWIVPALLPFALSLYAYGTTIVVLPLLLGAVLVLAFGRLRRHAGAWLLALGLFLLVAAPFLLFFTENYLAHRNFAWTDRLFFSTPLLPANRISQVSGTWGATLAANLKFVAAGFDDGTSYNLLPGFSLLPPLVLPLAALALVVGARRAARRLRSGVGAAALWDSPRAGVLTVFALWGLASLGLFFAFELNVNRFNHFFLPCLGLAAWGLPLLLDSFRPEVPKRLLWAGVLGWLALQSGRAIQNLFGAYRQGPIREQFNDGLGEAFSVVGSLWGINQVRITSQMPLPYVYTLFYLRYPPAQFQREADVRVAGGTYQVRRFGRYVFADELLTPNQPYGYLSRKNELADTGPRHRQVIFTNDAWEVGIVEPGPAR